MKLTLESSAFKNGASIPRLYTCEGDDISPPLIWSQLPPETKSLVLIVDDPDAPDPAAPKMTWVHWLLYNIPSDSSGLAQDISASNLPAGTQQGLNDWQRLGYGGPCPPIGRHHYFFKLYALDCVLADLITPTKTKLEASMQGHILEHAELMGSYAKQA